MGLAASQARLLSLTSKISDLELRSQRLTNSKVSLANKTEAISREYAEALDKKGLQVTLPNENGVFVTKNATLNDIYDAGFRLVDRKNGNDTPVLPPLPTVLEDSDYIIGNFGQPELKGISGQLKTQATSLGKGNGTITPCAKPAVLMNTKPVNYISSVTTAPIEPSRSNYSFVNMGASGIFSEQYIYFESADPTARRAFQAYYGINKIVAESMSYGDFSDLEACGIDLMFVDLGDFGGPKDVKSVLGFDLGFEDTPKLRNCGYDSSYSNVIDFIADAYGAETAYKFYTASSNINDEPTCAQIQSMMSSRNGFGSSAYANIASKMRGREFGRDKLRIFSDAVVDIDTGIEEAIQELEGLELNETGMATLKASMLTIFGLMTSGQQVYNADISLKTMILDYSDEGKQWMQMVDELENCAGNQDMRFEIIKGKAIEIANSAGYESSFMEALDSSNIRTIFDNMHVGSANGFVQDYYGVTSNVKDNFILNLYDTFTSETLIERTVPLAWSDPSINDAAALGVDIKDAYSASGNDWIACYNSIRNAVQSGPFLEKLEGLANNGYDDYMNALNNYRIRNNSYLWDTNLNYYAGLVRSEYGAFQEMQAEQMAELEQRLDDLGLSYTQSTTYPTLDSYVDSLQAGSDLGQVIMAKGTGYLSTILAYKGSGNGIYLQQKVLGEDNSPIWEDASVEDTGVLSWARDKSEEAIAEAKYNKALSSVKNKEKAIDREIAKTDTQHRAATTEYDSVKSVIDKNLKDSVGSLFS